MQARGRCINLGFLPEVRQGNEGGTLQGQEEPKLPGVAYNEEELSKVPLPEVSGHWHEARVGLERAGPRKAFPEDHREETPNG